MRNKTEYMRHVVVLITAVAGLIICAAPSLTSSGLAYAQAGAPSWRYTGSLNCARSSSATLLPNGKVLVVGGCEDSGGRDSAELYDPATGTWSYTGSLNTSRRGHTATLLQNGKVLVAGGYTANGDLITGFINTAELYDPSTGTWSYTGSLNRKRSGHTATLLQNDKVLVAGGSNSDEYVTNSAELYDPNTGEWSLTGALVASDGFTGRTGHTATLLQSGKVLVAGGRDGGDFSVFATELYDPATGTWSVSGRLNEQRGAHTATLLPNGNVLLAGACDAGINCRSGASSAELYNPATGTWSVTGAMNTPRFSHTATLLPDGRVLIAGGLQINFPGGTSVFLNSAEIYDPASGTWSTIANLNEQRYFHAATLLQNGKVLVVGGLKRTGLINPFFSPLQSAELYNSGSSSTINPIDDAQFFVRQHYLDFLSREPEAEGLAAWLRVLNTCNGDPNCLDGVNGKRVLVSQSFFQSQEFQLKGYFVFRFYKAAFARLPSYAEIVADMQSVTGQTTAEVYARKATFADAFVQRSEFINTYGALSNAAYVTALLSRYGLNTITATDPAQPDGAVKVTLTQADLVARLDSNSLMRAQVLRAVADSDEVFAAEFNKAFVAMQYYGYLRRAPEEAGYNAWLNYLNANPTDYRTMVHGFVYSIEYRMRFGQP